MLTIIASVIFHLASSACVENPLVDQSLRSIRNNGFSKTSTPNSVNSGHNFCSEYLNTKLSCCSMNEINLKSKKKAEDLILDLSTQMKSFDLKIKESVKKLKTQGGKLRADGMNYYNKIIAFSEGVQEESYSVGSFVFDKETFLGMVSKILNLVNKMTLAGEIINTYGATQEEAYDLVENFILELGKLFKTGAVKLFHPTFKNVFDKAGDIYIEIAKKSNNFQEFGTNYQQKSKELSDLTDSLKLITVTPNTIDQFGIFYYYY